MAGTLITAESPTDGAQGAQGKMMANDEEWVADVKRWYLAGTRSGAGALPGSDDGGDEIALGYEAADPALQAHHWPDAPTTGR